MDRATELELIDELRGLEAECDQFLDAGVTTSPIERYTSGTQFRQERDGLFHALPVAVAISAELPEPGSFLRSEIAGRPLLLTRDSKGEVHAFANVCRHRGARLVDAASGCKHRFSCPYHAWTYGSDGSLLAVPHEAAGFPGLDKAEMGLHAFQCVERHGLIWVSLAADAPLQIDAWLDELNDDIAALDLAAHVIHDLEDRVIHCNWKILIEGGIEAYHFKVAHRSTIAPLFLDNLSSYQVFGPHMRSILPRSTMPGLDEADRDSWSLRSHSNIIYSVLPLTQFQVQEDHTVWIQLFPEAPDRTRIRLATVVPKESGAPDSYWQKNHEFTVATLSEDFALGESIQAGLGHGSDALLFGRYEGALDAFNAAVDAHLAPV